MEVTITYDAKCKDCIFLKQRYFGKMKRHVCTNVKSQRHYPENEYLSQVRLKDLVCNEWKLTNDEINENSGRTNI